MRHTFPDLEIDEETFSIRRNGLLVEVEPRVFDFVLYLIRHGNRVVPKAELLTILWKGYAVGDAVLTRCAYQARKAVGDPRCIRTVHARGYQWVGPVGPGNSPEACRFPAPRNEPAS
jgi:DNA-binding winged helix-turn-helix (wHTH) protein